MFLLVLFTSLLGLPGGTPGESGSGPGEGVYQHYRDLAVAAGGPSPEGYVVKVVLSNADFDLSKVKQNGSDLAFSTLGDPPVPLDHWVLKWNDTARNGESVVFVRLPSSLGGATTLRMRYGNDLQAASLSNCYRMAPLVCLDAPGFTHYGSTADEASVLRPEASGFENPGTCTLNGNAFSGGRGVTEPNVVWKGGTFHMVYRGSTGYCSRLSVATSADGVTWTKRGSPIVGNAAAYPCLVEVGGQWNVFFGDLVTGAMHRIVATGDFLTANWTFANGGNPVLQWGGAAWEGGDFITNCAVKVHDAPGVGPRWSMLYEAQKPGPCPTGACFVTGMATSLDGNAWTKLNGATPAIDAGPADSWDEDGAANPTLDRVVYPDGTGRWLAIYCAGWNTVGGGKNRLGAAFTDAEAWSPTTLWTKAPSAATGGDTSLDVAPIHKAKHFPQEQNTCDATVAEVAGGGVSAARAGAEAFKTYVWTSNQGANGEDRILLSTTNGSLAQISSMVEGRKLFANDSGASGCALEWRGTLLVHGGSVGAQSCRFLATAPVLAPGGGDYEMGFSLKWPSAGATGGWAGVHFGAAGTGGAFNGYLVGEKYNAFLIGGQAVNRALLWRYVGNAHANATDVEKGLAGTAQEIKTGVYQELHVRRTGTSLQVLLDDASILPGGSPVADASSGAGFGFGAATGQRIDIRHFYIRPLVGGDRAVTVGAEQTPPTVPGAPQGLAVADGVAHRLDLSWSAPATEGGSPVQGFKVYRGAQPDAMTLLATTTSGANTSFHDAEVTPGATFLYAVAAYNAQGDGAWTAPVGGYAWDLPTAPTGLTATAGDAQVALSWSPSAAQGYPIRYAIFRGASSGGEAFLAETGPFGSANTSFVDHEVANGVAYFYTVRAVHGKGAGPSSGEATATPAPAPTVPGSPGTPTVSAGNGATSLSWTAAAPNGAAVTRYEIHRATTGGFTPSPSSRVASTSALSYDDAGLANGVTYYYRVAAVNSVGEGPPSGEASGTPRADPPGAPQELTATAGDEQVRLCWGEAAPNGAPVTGYRIHRATTGGFTPGPATFVASTAARSYTDAGLANGVTYHYRVTALNGAGEGAPSGEASSTTSDSPLPGVPVDVPDAVACPPDAFAGEPSSAPPSGRHPQSLAEGSLGRRRRWTHLRRVARLRRRRASGSSTSTMVDISSKPRFHRKSQPFFTEILLQRLNVPSVHLPARCRTGGCLSGARGFRVPPGR